MCTNMTDIHKISFDQLASNDEVTLNLAVALFLKPNQQPGIPYYRTFRNMSHSIEISDINAAITRQGLNPEFVKYTPLGRAAARSGIYFSQSAWSTPDLARKEFRAILRWVLKTPDALNRALKLDALLQDKGINCKVLGDITGRSSSFNNGLYGFPGLTNHVNHLLRQILSNGCYDFLPNDTGDVNNVCLLRTSGYPLQFTTTFEDDIEDEYGNIYYHGKELIRVNLAQGDSSTPSNSTIAIGGVQ